MLTSLLFFISLYTNKVKKNQNKFTKWECVKRDG